MEEDTKSRRPKFTSTDPGSWPGYKDHMEV